MSHLFHSIFLLLFVFLLNVHSLNILVSIVAIGHSHITFMNSIADNLALRGHIVDVVVIQVDPKYSSQLAKNVNSTVILPSKETNAFASIKFVEHPFEPINIFDSSLWKSFGRAMEQTCEDVIDAKEMLFRMKNNKYDVGIAETWGPAPFALLQMVGVREFILASATPISAPVATLFGIPMPPSYTASALSEGVAVSAPNFSFSQRGMNLIGSLFNNYGWWWMTSGLDQLFSKNIDKTFPSGRSLLEKSALILVNNPVVLSLPQPTSSRVLHIGGIAVKRDSETEIDKVLRKIVDTAKHVVLVSFGTVAKTETIRHELLLKFLNAFASFPDYDFIWKFTMTPEIESLFSPYKNVHPLEWIQQKGILQHSKTRAIVSHLGQNTFMEASFHGVPIVAIPFFADQFANTAVAVNRGTAVYVDKQNITEEGLREALEKVVLTESFYNNAQALKQELLQFPEDPARKMLDYVEYIAKVGRLAHLDLPGRNQGIIEYFCLDIILLFVIVLSVFFIVFFKILSFLLRTFLRRLFSKQKTD